MGKEIERKFLLRNNKWKMKAEGRTLIKQGYLNTSKERTVRVRVRDDKAYLTIKGKTVGMTRLEFEYPIPVREAMDLLVFSGDNAGLALAEVELTDENQRVPIPRWIGQEVTGDPRYYNSSLVKLPFKDWE